MRSAESLQRHTQEGDFLLSQRLGAGAGTGPAPAVELSGITKRFGGVTACDGVDLSLHRGRFMESSARMEPVNRP